MHTTRPRSPLGAQRVLAAVTAVAVPAVLAVGLAAQAHAIAVCSSTAPAAGSTVTCTVDGTASISVPTGSTSATVSIAGAGGGGGYASGGDGGTGALVTGTLDLTGLATIDVVVGAGGSGRINHATMSTGGGYSALLAASTPLVVAGGGGGGGASYRGGHGAAASTAAGGDGVGDINYAPGLGGANGTGGAAAGGSGSNPGASWASGGAGGTAAVGGGGGAGYGGGGAGRGGIYESGGGAGGSYASGAVSSVNLSPAGGAGGAARAQGVTGSAPTGSTGTVTIVFSAAPAPAVTAISPSSGTTAGGTAVGVTGSHFGSGSTVTVGGQPCTSVVVSSATALTCTTPAHAAGAADVVVTSGGQSATLAGGYTYQPAGSPGAPTGVVATAGTSSVTVSWSAPTSGAPVLQYVVTTTQGSASCTTTSTSCVLGGVAGTSYVVSVVAVGQSATSAAAQATSGAVGSPIVLSAPPADALLTLTTDKGRITRADTGQRIVVIGTGFAPYSTATIVIYSSPLVLGMVVTDADGDFSKPVTVPASLAAGVHDLVASGVDPQGATRSLRMEVSVTAAVLADTGFSAAVPLAGGALLLVVGSALIAGARREQA